MKLLRWLFVLALVLGLAGGGAAWWLGFSPNTPAFEDARSVMVPRGSDFDALVDSLNSADLLANAGTFRLFGDLTGWADQVKPGYYTFETGATNWALLDKIRKGLVDPIRVTVPPGVRPGVLAAVLRRDLAIDSTEFRQALRNTDLAAELGTDTTHLFGRMRANTFDIYWTQDAAEVVRRIHTWYERFWTDEREAKAQALGLTPDEVVTIASIVEWEARLPEERPRVAGVYLNRLLGRTSAGRMPLQADPTVQYALMQQDGGRMRRLLFADYALDHPYNTYKYAGLPPGPINNPSESSIDGVLDNEEHAYLYFVADGSGAHVFSRTLREHNRAADEYRALMRLRRAQQAAD
ncbi:MAG: endolytic transglycosylase MltG [Bacteroidota bacterium]